MKLTLDSARLKHVRERAKQRLKLDLSNQDIFKMSNLLTSLKPIKKVSVTKRLFKINYLNKLLYVVAAKNKQDKHPWKICTILTDKMAEKTRKNKLV